MTWLALSMALAAAPCQRVVLLPLEPVATTARHARELEEKARATLSAKPGVCLEPRAETLQRLRALERPLAPCRELACSLEQLTQLGVDVMVQGMVLGLGGKDTLSLTVTRATGQSRTLGEPAELGALLALTSADAEQDVSGRGPRWPTFVAGGLALGALGAGLGLGVSAKERESALSMGMACATSTGPAFASCLDGQLVSGRTEATAANVLFAVSGALLIAATVMLFVEWP